MHISPMAKRILIDGFLWVVIVFCCWFMLTRHFVAFFAIEGRWQVPGISRVVVGNVERDINDTFTDILHTVNKDGSQSFNRLLKKELVGVRPGDKMWLIYPPYVATVAFPPAYRFSFFRLVTEFPEFFLLICGCWLFTRFYSRLGKPFDAYEGHEKTSVTYVDPSPDSWGRSKLLISKKNQDENS